MVLEKTLKSPLDCQEIQPVHSKRDQSWVFIGRTDVEAETPILWPPDAKSWLIWKDTDAGNDWGQEEKGTREDEMVGWHHRLNGHGFGWTPAVGDGQGGLHFQFSLPCIGEGNGNPLQYSSLENPRDRGAWWASLYGVTQSRTWLKQLSSSSSSKPKSNMTKFTLKTLLLV